MDGTLSFLLPGHEKKNAQIFFPETVVQVFAGFTSICSLRIKNNSSFGTCLSGRKSYMILSCADLFSRSFPIGMSLLLQAPRFALPPEVEKLQAGEFQSVVRSADASGKNVAWLVMFHADWCSGSTNLQPMFAALARR